MIATLQSQVYLSFYSIMGDASCRFTKNQPPPPARHCAFRVSSVKAAINRTLKIPQKKPKDVPVLVFALPLQIRSPSRGAAHTFSASSLSCSDSLKRYIRATSAFPPADISMATEDPT